MHPEGTFAGVIVDHGLTRAATGTLQACIKVETEKGQITGFFPLTDKSAQYTMKTLRAMGFPGDNVAALNDDPPICQGNDVEIVVENEKYHDKVNAKIKWINAPGSSRGMEIKKDAAAAALAKKFNALLKQEPVVEKEEAPKDEKGNDGIPF